MGIQERRRGSFHTSAVDLPVDVRKEGPSAEDIARLTEPARTSGIDFFVEKWGKGLLAILGLPVASVAIEACAPPTVAEVRPADESGQGQETLVYVSPTATLTPSPELTSTVPPTNTSIPDRSYSKQFFSAIEEAALEEAAGKMEPLVIRLQGGERTIFPELSAEAKAWEQKNPDLLQKLTWARKEMRGAQKEPEEEYRELRMSFAMLNTVINEAGIDMEVFDKLPDRMKMELGYRHMIAAEILRCLELDRERLEEMNDDELSGLMLMALGLAKTIQAKFGAIPPEWEAALRQVEAPETAETPTAAATGTASPVPTKETTATATSTPSPEALNMTEWGLRWDKTKQVYVTTDSRYGLPEGSTAGIYAAEKYFVNGEARTGVVGLRRQIVEKLQAEARTRGEFKIPLPLDPRGMEIEINMGISPYDPEEKKSFLGLQGLKIGTPFYAPCKGEFWFRRHSVAPDGSVTQVAALKLDNGSEGFLLKFDKIGILIPGLEDGERKLVTIGTLIVGLQSSKDISFFPGTQQVAFVYWEDNDTPGDLTVDNLFQAGDHLVFLLLD